VRNAIKHYEEIQTVLGELQDTVVARNTLLRLATKAGMTPGEGGFTYGLLYAKRTTAGRSGTTRRAKTGLTSPVNGAAGQMASDPEPVSEGSTKR
jgi:hypothetical protein